MMTFLGQRSRFAIALAIAAGCGILSTYFLGFGSADHSEAPSAPAIESLAPVSSEPPPILGPALAGDLWAEMRGAPGGIAEGNSHPSEVMVVFVDYRCPYCHELEGQVAEILQRRPGLQIIWRPWPILGISSQQMAVDVLSEPLPEQLAAHKAQYADPPPAASLRLLAPDQAYQAIAANKDLATRLDLSGVPSLFIAGRPYGGDLEADEIVGAIENAADPGASP